MPPRTWPHDPVVAAQALDSRDAEAGVLVMWAAWAVDGIYHLVDVHNDLFERGASLRGHHEDTVQAAHARWATGSAITALDLCAGALGRLHCGQTGDRLLDVRDLDPAVRKSKKPASWCYAQLPTLAQEWVDAVVSDDDYRIVRQARNPFTHNRLARTLTLRGGGVPASVAPRDRTSFHVDGQPFRSTDLIAKSKELASRHVEAFLSGVLAGAL